MEFPGVSGEEIEWLQESFVQTISERLEVWVVDSELLVCLFSVHFEDDDHEGAHEEARICDLGKVSAAAVVVNSRVTLE